MNATIATNETTDILLKKNIKAGEVVGWVDHAGHHAGTVRSVVDCFAFGGASYAIIDCYDGKARRLFIAI